MNLGMDPKHIASLRRSSLRLCVLAAWGWLPLSAESAVPATGASVGRLPVVRIEAHGPAAETGPHIGSTEVRGRLEREILDPCVGARWQLLSDVEHPERPGHWVMVEPGSYRNVKAGSIVVAPAARADHALTSSILPYGTNPGNTAVENVPVSFSIPVSLPERVSNFVIRSGDRIAVFQETPILRAQFQAVALESAAAGQPIRVRLAGASDTRAVNPFVSPFGNALASPGAVITVRVEAPGEARWLTEDPRRP